MHIGIGIPLECLLECWNRMAIRFYQNGIQWVFFFFPFNNNFLSKSVTHHTSKITSQPPHPLSPTTFIIFCNCPLTTQDKHDDYDVTEGQRGMERAGVLGTPAIFSYFILFYWLLSSLQHLPSLSTCPIPHQHVPNTTNTFSTHRTGKTHPIWQVFRVLFSPPGNPWDSTWTHGIQGLTCGVHELIIKVIKH